jgi:hypothetical protein
MKRGDIKAWLAARSEAESAERSGWSVPLEPGRAVDQAMELARLWESLFGWPAQEDAVRIRESNLLSARWDRLRASKALS